MEGGSILQILPLAQDPLQPFPDLSPTVSEECRIVKRERENIEEEARWEGEGSKKRKS